MTGIGIQSPGLEHPPLPLVESGGVRTPAVQILPPAANVVAYVRSGGLPLTADEDISRRLKTTLAAALPLVRPGTGDTIVVLPGHSENVTDATMFTNLVAGTKIVGVGNVNQDDAPTFRWTNTAGSWTIDQKNVSISGLRLRMEGANLVVKCIDVTAAGFTLANCNIETSSGASNRASICLEIGAGANECTVAGNYFRGLTASESLNVMLVDAAISNLRVVGNTAIASSNINNGILSVTAAATNMDISGNRFYNTHTASVAAINFANVACDGFCTNNLVGVKNNGVAASQGIVFGAAALVVCAENYCVDEPRASGVLAPAAVAT